MIHVNEDTISIATIIISLILFGLTGLLLLLEDKGEDDGND